MTGVQTVAFPVYFLRSSECEGLGVHYARLEIYAFRSSAFLSNYFRLGADAVVEKLGFVEPRNLYCG